MAGLGCVGPVCASARASVRMCAWSLTVEGVSKWEYVCEWDVSARVGSLGERRPVCVCDICVPGP